MANALSRESLQRLGLRRNGPALAHLAIQCMALILSAGMTVRLSADQHPAKWLAVLACGVCVLTFFPLLHESGHQTAFKSRGWNEACVWLGALMMLQAPSFFREFHWEHHRSTQDPEHDPEISGAPAILDGWPTNPLTYLFLVSGQFLMIGKLGFTIACALLPLKILAQLFPFIRADRQRRVARESRIALLLISAFVGLGWRFVPAFPMLLLAWPVAHLYLGFYLMAEHTGLGRVGDQLQRTRTVRTNLLVRWLMWNMPYHAEHHAHPGIPYHALPPLHEALGPDLPHSHSGYLRFHLDALAHAFRIR